MTVDVNATVRGIADSIMEQEEREAAERGDGKILVTNFSEADRQKYELIVRVLPNANLFIDDNATDKLGRKMKGHFALWARDGKSLRDCWAYLNKQGEIEAKLQSTSH